MLETYRLLVDRLAGSPPALTAAKQMAKLPLWTSRGWKRRPVWAVDDPTLADSLGQEVPVWQPGGELQQFRSLLPALRIVEVQPSGAAVIGPELAEEDEEATTLLRRAVALLREDLARNEPQAAASLGITWAELEAMRVLVLPGLEVDVQDVSRVPVSAKAQLDPVALFVTDPTVVAAADGGGRAIASLFRSERRRVAQAWRTAWDGAERGRQAELLVLAEQRTRELQAQTAAEIAARTASFREEVAGRHTPPSPAGAAGAKPIAPPPSAASALSSSPTPSAGPAPAPAPAPARVLVDPHSLALVSPDGELIERAGSPNPSGAGGCWQPKALAVPRAGGATPRERTAPPQYTGLSKESVGLELVRRVLNSDAAAMVDLRAQRNVGADAIDDLKRFYELKVFSRAEPDHISLTPAEIQPPGCD